MILQNEYLTDEELEQLISEVEADELITAPPELKENIVRKVFGEAHREPKESSKRKRREFAGYCFRVAMSVAAAVAFIFIMPHLPGFGDSEDIMQQPGIIESSGVNRPDIPSWEDEEGKDTEELDYPTREEVLNETNILHRVFGGNNIFTGNNDFNIFTEKDGGQ